MFSCCWPTCYCGVPGVVGVPAVAGLLDVADILAADGVFSSASIPTDPGDPVFSLCLLYCTLQCTLYNETY
jgi:hypothetical protein